MAIVCQTHEVLAAHRVEDFSLAPHEVARAAGLHDDADRDDYLAAHLLVRIAAARLLDRDARTLVMRQRCMVCGGEHGAVSLEDSAEPRMSLSHASGMVAAIVGRNEVAIDVEPVPAVPDRMWADRFLSPEEAALLPTNDPDMAAVLTRWWVRKECLVKLGAATLDGLGEVDLSHLGTGAHRVPKSIDRAPVKPGTALVDWVGELRGYAGAATMQRHDWKGWDPLAGAGAGA